MKFALTKKCCLNIYIYIYIVIHQVWKSAYIDFTNQYKTKDYLIFFKENIRLCKFICHPFT